MALGFFLLAETIASEKRREPQVYNPRLVAMVVWSLASRFAHCSQVPATVLDTNFNQLVCFVRHTFFLNQFSVSTATLSVVSPAYFQNQSRPASPNRVSTVASELLEVTGFLCEKFIDGGQVA